MSISWLRRRTNETAAASRESLSAVIEYDAFPAANALAVETDAGFPLQLNDPHPDNASSNLRVSRYRIRRRERSNAWFVSFDFDDPTLSRSGGAGLDPNDPLNSPTRIQWANAVNGEPIDRDVSGNPIINSSREPFDSNPQRDFTSKLLTLTRNEASFSIATALAYENTVNSAAWQGAEPGEARCLSILPATVYTAENTYVEVSYRFEFRAIEIWGDDPHQLRIQDQGFTSFADGGEVTLCNPNGQRFTAPVLLNGTGVPLSSTVTYLDSGNTPVASPTFTARSVPAGATIEAAGDARFLRYDRYPEADFNALSLI